ncbi:hypothetical protein IAI18_18815 [Acetobacteraceae bacterium H6797]|nr:hypothetical protein [Acetobacteraceae bacterium H6797]
MRPILLATLGLLGVSVLSAGRAQAQPVMDNATGLAVNPPAGYQARQMPAGAGQTARIVMRRASDAADTGCMAGFNDAKSLPGTTQAQINAEYEKRDMEAVAREAIGGIYDVRSTGRFDHAGVHGLLMVADIRPLPNIPPRSQQVRSMMVMLDTPKGRTTIVCVGEKAEFDARLAEYEQVARSVTPPG